MKQFINYFKGLFRGIKSLLTGMSVTASYFFRPSQIVTEQYPENRIDKKTGKITLKVFDEFKGEVIMPHNTNNEHKCTSCGICEINCPNGTIKVISEVYVDEEGKKKKRLDKHMYDIGLCTFCGLCVKTCPSDAIIWGQNFEHSVYSRDALKRQLNKEGSTLEKKTK